MHTIIPYFTQISLYIALNVSVCVKALYSFPFFPNQLVFFCSTLSVQVRLASSSGSDQS